MIIKRFRMSSTTSAARLVMHVLAADKSAVPQRGPFPYLRMVLQHGKAEPDPARRNRKMRRARP